MQSIYCEGTTPKNKLCLVASSEFIFELTLRNRIIGIRGIRGSRGGNDGGGGDSVGNDGGGGDGGPGTSGRGGVTSETGVGDGETNPLSATHFLQ